MRRTLVSAAAAMVVLGVIAVGNNPAATRGGFRPNPALAMALAAEQGTMPPRLPNGNFVPLLSGAYVHSAMDSMGLRTGRVHPADGISPPTIGTTGCPNVFAGPVDNVRANQDCGYRFQSEEWVAVNPTDSSNVVVSQNDSSLSGNHTGVDFSVDGGQHFGDSRLPSGRINIPDAPGGVWSFDFFSDPVHVFDSQGNLYYVTLGADFAQDGFDGVFAWKSNSCLKGSALHTPGSGSCDPFSPPLSATAVPIRTNFDNPLLIDDKELMAADTSQSSPFKDNLYVTWTIFNFTCGNGGGSFCDAPIFFSRSSDGGQTWTTAKEISGQNPNICNFGNFFDSSQPADACNNDQFSDPVVGSDGTIYVFFMNYNTNKRTETSPGGLKNQILMVKSTDGGDHWSNPKRVSFDFAGEPYSLPGHEIPDCDLFRQCLPPNGYRMADYPTAGIDPAGKLAVYWSDFRHGGPCATFHHLPVTPCANYNADIFFKTSSDGGNTWSDPLSLTKNGGTTAQWQPWGSIAPDGTLEVAYYDREYGTCENDGCNDITLATNSGSGWSHQRITTSSMPNLTCAINPNECGFLGDYMGLAIASNGTTSITWGDTRGQNGTTEEDVYYASVGGP